MSILTFTKGSAPASPSAGQSTVYIDTADDILKYKDEDGTVRSVVNTPPTYPKSAQLFPYFYTPVEISGSTQPKTITATFGRFGHAVDQGPGAPQAWDMHFFVEAGTYILELTSWLWDDQGILDLYIDGVLVDNVDLYSGANTTGNVTTITGITITGDGDHLLHGEVINQNVSSSAYYAKLEAIFIYQ